MTITQRIILPVTRDPKGRVTRASGTPEILLPARTLAGVDGDQRGTVARCGTGCVWITQAGDAADYIVRAGEAFTISRRGRVVIQALEPSAISIG